jgi:hypothetical protein
MRIAGRWVLLALSSMACSVGAQQLLVEVVITPDAYHVGAFKSPLATPAVDEVIRAKPGRVLVLTCVATPPGKVAQFEAELKARHPADMAIVFSDKLCVSA